MNEQLDRLYTLLPYIYQRCDAEMDYPLRDLLGVIAEQVNLVEGDIAQLYANWFIETCQEWAIPYVGDLVGYRLLPEEGEPGDLHAPPAGKKYLAPRREVANTIRYRRRKGTLPLLEELAWAVAGWHAQAEEYDDASSSSSGPAGSAQQNVTTPAPATQQSATSALPAPPATPPTPLRIRLNVWRLNTYPVDRAQACCMEEHGDHCFTFSALGNDTPLYNHPRPETDPAHIAELENLPVAITRKMLADGKTGGAHPKDSYYGPDRSFAIWAHDWPTEGAPQPIPFERIVAKDLGDWQDLPEEDQVAVDPELGRFMFPPSQLPPHGAWVTYHFAFSDDIGGGAYERPHVQQPGAVLYRVVSGHGRWRPPFDLEESSHEPGKPAFHPHPADRRICHTVNEALESWRLEKPRHAIIEIATNHVYDESVAITLDEGHSLQLRAANGCRPIIRLPERRVDRPDELSVRMAAGSHFILDGMLVAGPGVRVQDARISSVPHRREPPADWEPPDEETTALEPWADRRAPPPELQVSAPEPPALAEEPILSQHVPPQPDAAPGAPTHVTIRRCTLVPGWTLEPDCEPREPTEPSLEIALRRGKVAIEHSIVGSIQVTHNEVKADPIEIEISDSVVDATRHDCTGEKCTKPECEALGAPGRHMAHAVLTLRRCTVLGCIQAHAVILAENSIFMGHVRVARRQIGCVRCCYVTPVSRTPPRHHCQPDLVIASSTSPDPAQVRPVFTATRYGQPAYCQLAETCADEIRRGADDGSEMGAFHDLFQPQREANLAARLQEYTPPHMAARIFFVS